jgi:hypothetical protein
MTTTLSHTGTAASETPWAHRAALAFRITAVLFVLDTLLQATLAALFVTGDVGLLPVHNANAQVLTTVLLLETIAAAVVMRTTGSEQSWPVALGVVLLGMVVVQQIVGHARLLLVHIPLGVAIFGGACALLVRAFQGVRR